MHSPAPIRNITLVITWHTIRNTIIYVTFILVIVIQTPANHLSRLARITKAAKIMIRITLMGSLARTTKVDILAKIRILKAQAITTQKGILA